MPCQLNVQVEADVEAIRSLSEGIRNYLILATKYTRKDKHAIVCLVCDFEIALEAAAIGLIYEGFCGPNEKTALKKVRKAYKKGIGKITRSILTGKVKAFPNVFGGELE